MHKYIKDGIRFIDLNGRDIEKLQFGGYVQVNNNTVVCAQEYMNELSARENSLCKEFE